MSQQYILNQLFPSTTTTTSSLAGVSDTTFELFDNLDSTKQALFSLVNLTSNTTRTYNLPDASGVVVLADNSQTLTNKILTKSQISDLPTMPTSAIVGINDTQTLTNKSISKSQIIGLPTFPSSTIVGTSDSQTLTNKTLDTCYILNNCVPIVNNSSNLGSNSFQYANMYLAGTAYIQNASIQNLSVLGTQTFVDTSNLNVDSNIIMLNAGLNNTTAPSINATIQVDRGNQTNASLLWNESVGKWKAGLLGSEVEIATISTTQTLTNKILTKSQITDLPTFPSGSIVGTSDSQTLTNKTLDTCYILNNCVPITNNSSNLGSSTFQFANMYLAGTAYIQNASIQNLSVLGTQTFVDTNNLNVNSNIIMLNAGLNNTTAPSINATIQVDRGNQTNASLLWNESVGKWKVGLLGSEVEIATISTTQTLSGKTLNAPVVTANLTFSGNNNALVLPNLNTTQQNALTQSAGMAIYNSGLGYVYISNGTTWTQLVDSSTNQTLTNKTLYQAYLNGNAQCNGNLTITSNGCLVPASMTTATKNAIASPATGSVVYDTTLNSLQIYNGSSWASVGGGTSTSYINRTAIASFVAINSTNTTVTLNTTSIDNLNWPSAVTSGTKIYFPVTGYYHISLEVASMSGSASSACGLFYNLLNSSATVIESYYLQASAQSTDHTRLNSSFMVNITDVTNYLQLVIWQNSGTSVTFSTGFIMMNKIN
jgi:hypothetical protein